METVVPSEVTAELTQILSNLVLGDNQIRSNAENAVNERLATSPELYMLALAQFAMSADKEVMRSFALVLLRRLLFRTQPNTSMTLYDHLTGPALAALERLLLRILAAEPSPAVRPKAVDTICDLANNSMGRGKPWHALQSQAFSMTQSDDPNAREGAYRVLAGCPNLILDLDVATVIGLLQKGLQDSQSVEVRLAALKASTTYLSSIETHQLAQSLALMYPILDTLPALSNTHLPKFLAALTPLATSSPTLFAPHLPALLSFFSALLAPTADPGPTPTVARPFPSSGSSAFTFPPPNAGDGKGGKGKEPAEEVDEEREEVRKATLELMISLSEARPGMVKRVSGWVTAVVRGCLEGMGELPEGELDVWLDADPDDDPTDDSYPHVYEQSLDRLAIALGGKSVLPPAFQYIPAMLASHDWRLRHAGLMAIAAVAEGTHKVMANELGKVVELVVPMFKDSNPRVRYAACQCIGQLCTDMEEIIQERYHEELFAALIPTLDAPEPRVHAHAAAALINFCEGVARETLIPYLDPIFERLLRLLNPAGESGRVVKRYVQEQAITTLAMVADASEATFAKHYSSIMPLLLNVLQNAAGSEYQKLRLKAMECAGLIAIAVGRDVFRPDSAVFIEQLMRIQNSPLDSSDTLLPHYLIATWAKVCQALGPEFEPYLPVVMPALLRAASAKADVSIYDSMVDDDEEHEDKEGWETISMDGQQVGIKTSAIEEKCQAFETLVIYCSTLQAKFAPYLPQSLELVLPSLRFYFHDGVREASALLVPMLLSCGKHSGTLTHQMVNASFTQVASCMASENDASFLASLYRSFTDSLRVIGGSSALPHEIQAHAIDATKRQLNILAERRKARAEKPSAEIEDEREDIALLEEMEDFALEDMEKMLKAFDPNHPLVVAISSVKELGLHLGEWSEDEGDEEG
ncbi:ARM repeat-containing protein [Neolentinus lepideus HHB14362 ss-1]|uniref:ARM repeat-containing protein n=1 Tax=Neolentinus lepideus HHB14362 ss-1 TaxID=1314782 RepID=A0A165MLT0_9AGAM|nr:ARM repeat-containing protein [Neolentinus lepideus HHB14362 ss-1]